MHHSFDIEIAKKYGVEVAVVLNNIAFWINKNRANNKHFHDGRYWTYNSIKAFRELFPYWSFKQMRNILNKLKETGVILIGNFNEKNYDQTTWYALTDEGLNLFNIPICPNGQMDLPKQDTPFAQMGKCIYRTDVKPDINTDFDKPIENQKSDIKKTKANWRDENIKKHRFARSMEMMGNEQEHIHQHNIEKATPMPSSLKSFIKQMNKG